MNATRHALTISVPTKIGPLPRAVGVEGECEERSAEKAAVGPGGCIGVR